MSGCCRGLVFRASVSWPLPRGVIIKHLPWIEPVLGQLSACYRADQEGTVSRLYKDLRTPPQSIALPQDGHWLPGAPGSCKITAYTDMRTGGQSRLAIGNDPLGKTTSGTQSVRLQGTHAG